MRKLIYSHSSLEKIFICGEGVFADAVVNTIVFLLQKTKQSSQIQIYDGIDNKILMADDWKNTKNFAIDYRLDHQSRKLLNKLKMPSIMALSEFGETIQGITAYDKYTGQDPLLIKERRYHFRKKKDKTCEKWLEGKDVSRFYLGWSGEWLSYGPWLAAPRDPRFFTGARILFREVPGQAKRIQASIAYETFYHGHSITPFLPSSRCQESLEYLLGIVNSKYLSWIGRLILPNFGKEVFPKLNPQDIKDLPIRTINFNKRGDRTHHDKIVLLVKQLISSKQSWTSAQTENDKTYYNDKCKSLDRQIDALVYELYGLTEDEIAIVEDVQGKE